MTEFCAAQLVSSNSFLEALVLGDGVGVVFIGQQKASV